jgi:hypothetical protein
MLLMDYFEVSGFSRFEAGVDPHELITLMDVLEESVGALSDGVPEIASLETERYRAVGLAIELAKDEIRHQYDMYCHRDSAVPESAPDEVPGTGATKREQLQDTIWKCLVQRK